MLNFVPKAGIQIGLFLIGIFFCLNDNNSLASPAVVEKLHGTVELNESATIVNNPTFAINEPRHSYPEEVWRLDGSSDTSVIGVIYGVVADKSGTIYLLDVQQKEVVVVDLLGKIVNRIGGPGQGPGEFVRPYYIFVDDKSRVGVMQNIPRKIEMFSSSGEVLGTHPLPKYGESLQPTLRGVNWANNRVYMVLLSRDIDERGNSTDNNALVSIAEETMDMVIYEERIFSRSVMNAHFIEKEMTRVCPWKWTVGPQGEVYSNRVFDSYKINVHDIHGKLIRIICRDYSSYPRPDWHVRELQESKDKKFEGRYIRGIPMTYEVSPTDPDIEKLFARDDGTLWVLTSRGAYDQPSGILGTFDVFDAAGHFDHEAVLHGVGDFFYDYYFISHGYLIVIHNVLRSVDDIDWAESEKDNKYEIICYRL